MQNEQSSLFGTLFFTLVVSIVVGASLVTIASLFWFRWSLCPSKAMNLVERRLHRRYHHSPPPLSDRITKFAFMGATHHFRVKGEHLARSPMGPSKALSTRITAGSGEGGKRRRPSCSVVLLVAKRSISSCLPIHFRAKDHS